MKKHLIFPLIFVVVGAIACGGDEARRGDQKASYDTVQEGSAVGVTSTIQGPGQSLPPITGTNADTTTAFSINPNGVATTNAVPPPNAGTMAGTLPPPAPIPGGMTQSAPYPRTAVPPMTSAAPAQPQRTVPVQPPPQQHQEPVEPPPATDTATTSTAATQPATTQTNPPQQQEQEDDDEEEPAPPTTTDTRGGM